MSQTLKRNHRSSDTANALDSSSNNREASSSDYDGASDDDSDLPALVDQMEVEEKMDQSVDDSDTDGTFGK